MRQRTQKRNALRSNLGERGLVAARGKATLYRLIESVITIDDDGLLCTDDEKMTSAPLDRLTHHC